jgi:hypothetical protein
MHFAGKTRIATLFKDQWSVTIDPPFHKLYTSHHDVQIQANQRLWLCIDPGRGVLFTIISANLACIGEADDKATRFYWIRFNNSRSLPFCPYISVYKSR